MKHEGLGSKLKHNHKHTHHKHLLDSVLPGCCYFSLLKMTNRSPDAGLLSTQTLLHLKNSLARVWSLFLARCWRSVLVFVEVCKPRGATPAEQHLWVSFFATCCLWWKPVWKTTKPTNQRKQSTRTEKGHQWNDWLLPQKKMPFSCFFLAVEKKYVAQKRHLHFTGDTNTASFLRIEKNAHWTQCDLLDHISNPSEDILIHL